MQIKQSSAYGVVLAFALVALPQHAFADAAPKWTDAELVGFADVIVRGHVSSVGVARDARVGSPYTYVALEVYSGVVSNIQMLPVVSVRVT